MKGVLRVAALYFTAVPLQRWLNGAALLLLLAALLTGGEHAGLALLGAFIALPIPFLMGGALWRSLASQRSLMLAPSARSKLLLAVVLVAIVCCVVMLTAAALQSPDSPLPQDARAWAVPFVKMLAFALAWLALSFIGAGLTNSWLTFLVMVLVIGNTLPVFRAAIGAIVGSPVTALVLYACWLTFVVWYLRAPQISPPRILMPGSNAPRVIGPLRTREVRSDFTRSQALQWRLWGRSLADEWSARFWITPIVIIALVASTLLWPDGYWAQILAPQLNAVMPVYAAFMAMALGFSASVRARWLWLCSGYTRRGIFGFVERQTLLRWLLIGPFLLLAGLVVNHMGGVTLSVAQLCIELSAVLLLCAAGLYIGMNVSGWPWLNGVLGVLLSAVWLFVHFTQLLATTHRWRATLALLAAGALVLVARHAVRSKWGSIDWQRYGRIAAARRTTAAD